MKVISLSLKDAEAFLKDHERHYKAPVEPICAIGVGETTSTTAINADGSGMVSSAGKFVLHGAAILGRRSAEVGELAHIYCDGASQSYSLLYGACWRALKALGYEQAVL